MKSFLCIILIVINIRSLSAQTAENSIKYIWKNNENNLTAAVEIFGMQNKKGAIPVFFLNKVDTAFNSSTDSLFNAFKNDISSICPVVRISFYYFDDSVSAKKIKIYSDAFTKSILPDIHKKYTQLSTDNIMVAGLNSLCLVALFSAANNSHKLNKTALLFNSEDEFSAMAILYSEASKNLKGKLYMYVNRHNYVDGFINSFAASVSLASSAVIYKYDHYDKPLPENFFTEAYKWLMADGNNYVITNGD